MLGTVFVSKRRRAEVRFTRLICGKLPRTEKLHELSNQADVASSSQNCCLFHWHRLNQLSYEDTRERREKMN